MPVTDALLHAWISGALEPPRALEIEEALRDDAELRARLERLRSQLRMPDAPSAWRLPPPGVLGGRLGLGVSFQPAEVFGGPLRPGDRFQLRLGSLTDAEPRWVVVLRKLDARWRVVFPTDPRDRLALTDLPEEDGERVLDLSAGPERGTQRWAVALPAVGIDVDWSQPDIERWRPVIHAVAAGEIPCGSVEIEVPAP
ncbi:MAG: hypothetical protein R3F61_05235 [Myxococcota bacterium]